MQRSRSLAQLALGLAAVGVLAGCAAATPTESAAPRATSHAAAEWSYSGATGPSTWGDVAATCGASETSTQSPIDIEVAQLAPDTTTGTVTTHYRPTTFEVENNGHTIEAVPDDRTADSVTIDGTDYVLQQFHLHNPSEHQVNGASAAMELHLVHKSSTGAIAVLAVLLQPGDANAPLGELFEKMPAHETDESSTVALTQQIDPATLLPAGSEIARYTGSLTTPPCTEGVLWNVYETTGTISADQLAAFNRIYPDNHRPLQPLHGRIVTEESAQ